MTTDSLHSKEMSKPVPESAQYDFIPVRIITIIIIMTDVFSTSS